MPSRRALLHAAGTAGVTGLPARFRWDRNVGSGGRWEPAGTLPVRVHVHRVPTIDERTRRRVVRAVDGGVEQVARTATGRLDRVVEPDVAAGGTAPRNAIVTATRDAVHDSTIDWLRDADRLTFDAIHLVLVDAPFSQSTGYGQNDAPLGAALADERPAVSYANVGATERWDDAAITANVAIHEVLHGLVDGQAVDDVLGRRCEHDLGAVHSVADRGAIVTPMATAYADPRFGVETQWPGSGCLGRLSQHVRFDPEWWEHTYALSEATRSATTQYLDRL